MKIARLSLVLVASLVAAQSISVRGPELQMSGSTISHAKTDGNCHVPRAFGQPVGYQLTTDGTSCGLAWAAPGGAFIDSARVAGLADTAKMARKADTARAAKYADTCLHCPTVAASDSARAAHLADSAKRSGFADSSRVSGLSDSAKKLVFYARITALRDTTDTLRKSIATKPVRHRFSISSTTGIPPLTLSYNNTTRVLTLTPTGTSFSWWWYGIEHVQTGPLVLPAHSATTGLYYASFDSLGAVTISTTPFDILRSVPIAIFDRNSTLAQTWVYPELHTDQITPLDHLARHTAVGALMVPGGAAISGYTLNSDLLASVTYGIGSATMWDEDAKHSIAALADGGPYQVRYRTALGVWSWASSLTTPYRVGTTYITADVAGVQTELNGTGLGQFVNYYVVLVPNLNGPQVVMFQGQAIHASAAAAEAETWQSLDRTGLPAVEFVPVWQVTYKAQVSYTGVSGRVQMVRATPVGATSAAGSAAATTLQAAYNASPTPQIVTSAAAGPLTIQRGTASDTNAVIQVANGAGTVTARINADGTYTGNALTASKLATSRSIRMHGDGEWIVNFDGSANVDSTFALASTGVTGGTYGSATQSAVVTFDNKGRANSASNVTITPAWTSVTGKPTAFAPATHATTHHSGGSDQITGQSLAGLTTSSSPQFAAALLSGTSPNLDVYVTGAPTTERRWRWSAYNDGTFGLSAQDDAGTGGGWAIQFDRTGTTPAGATIYGGLTLNGLPSGVVRSTGGVLSASALTYSDLTGTVPTWNQNTTGSAATLTTGRTIGVTGDATGTSAAFNGSTAVSIPLTLATVNANVGTFGSASTVAVPTVNGKGLITGITTATITPAAIGAQPAGTYLTSSNVSGAAGRMALFTGTNTVENSLLYDDNAGNLTYGGIYPANGTTNPVMTLRANTGTTNGGTYLATAAGSGFASFQAHGAGRMIGTTGAVLKLQHVGPSSTWVDIMTTTATVGDQSVTFPGKVTAAAGVNVSGGSIQINGTDAITSARAGNFTGAAISGDVTISTAAARILWPNGLMGQSGSAGVGFNDAVSGDLHIRADGSKSVRIGSYNGSSGPTSTLVVGLNGNTLNGTTTLSGLTGATTRLATIGTAGQIGAGAAYDGPWLPLTAGTGTPLTGILPISEGWPRLRLQETGVAANTGNWQIDADGGVAGLYVVNDAINGFSPVWTATRSTVTAAGMTIHPALSVPSGITGVTNGSTACAGCVGYRIESTIDSSSAVTTTVGTTRNVTSISLTAGDWEVSGAVTNTIASPTYMTRTVSGISATSATLPANGRTGNTAGNWAAPAVVTARAGDETVRISSTTTIYLVNSVEGPGGATARAYGWISAIRVR